MKKQVAIGDIFTVEILKNEKQIQGNPVCRIDTGIIGFVKIPEGMFVLPRSVWQVEITEISVSGKSCTVKPIDKVKTAWENLRDIEKTIKKTFHAIKPERKPKAKIKYTNQ